MSEQQAQSKICRKGKYKGHWAYYKNVDFWKIHLLVIYENSQLNYLLKIGDKNNIESKTVAPMTVINQSVLYVHTNIGAVASMCVMVSRMSPLMKNIFSLYGLCQHDQTEFQLYQNLQKDIFKKCTQRFKSWVQWTWVSDHHVH